MRRDVSVLLVAIVGIFLATPLNAHAYDQNYNCGPLPPAAVICQSHGLHSWDYNRAYYPGPASHNVIACEYLWNARTQRVRPSGPHCAYTDTGFIYYGATSQADYNARVYQGYGCCNHTIVGWAFA